MYVRLTRATSSSEAGDPDAAVERWKTVALPTLQSQKGYAGSFVARLDGGPDATAVSYWQDRESLDASDANSAALRERIGELGRDIRISDVETLELLLVERAQQPSGGTFMRTNDLHADPSRVDAAVALMRERLLPVLHQHGGFRSLVVGLNRDSGRMIVASTWDSLRDLQTSDAAVKDLRREVAEMLGAQGVKVETWNVVFLEMKAGTGVRP